MSDKTETIMQPCEQKDTIVGIKDDVREVKEGFKDMISEFRAMTKDLRDSLLDGRELKVEVTTLKRDMNIAFDELRIITTKESKDKDELWDAIEDFKKEAGCCRDNRIKPLEEWRARIDERFNSMKIVPIVCAVIVSVLTIINLIIEFDRSKEYSFDNHSHKESK